MTTHLLIVDDSEFALEYVPAVVTDRLGWQVTTARCPHQLETTLRGGQAFDVALVDLTYRACGSTDDEPRPECTRTGLHALLLLHDQLPACHTVVYTQLDHSVEDMLRDAWDGFPLASALSKSLPSAALLDALKKVARDGRVAVDPPCRLICPRSGPRGAHPTITAC